MTTHTTLVHAKNSENTTLHPLNSIHIVFSFFGIFLGTFFMYIVIYSGQNMTSTMTLALTLFGCFFWVALTSEFCNSSKKVTVALALVILASLSTAHLFHVGSDISTWQVFGEDFKNFLIYILAICLTIAGFFGIPYALHESTEKNS